MKHIFTASLIAITAISSFGVSPANANCNSNDCKSLEYGSDNYIGIGAKTDVENVGIISKFKVVDLDSNKKLSVSVRPQVYTDFDDVSVRVPATLDYKVTKRLTLFGGAGVDYNSFTDDVQPVITGGVDYKLNKDFTVTGGIDYLTEDDDVQGKIGIGYNF